MVTSISTARRALTAIEQGLYLSSLLQPEARSYHRTSAVRLTAPAVAERVRGALEQVARRHPALRTTFHRGRGALWAETSATAALELETVAAGSSDGLAEAVRASVARMARPFDLAHAAFRFALVVGDGDAVLVTQAHHIAMDALSEQVLAVDLATALAGLPLSISNATARPLGAPDAGLDRLRDALHGAPAVLSLRDAAERPAVRRDHSLRADVAPTSERVGAAAAQERITPFTMLLAAWSQALATLGDCDDVVIGVPFSIRQPHQDHELGCFVNMVPVRVATARTASFCARLADARAAMRIAYGAARVPFAQLCAALRPPRAGNYHAVFQAAFTLRPRPAWPIVRGDVVLDRLAVDLGASIYDWRLDLEPAAAGRYAGFVECAADITSPPLAAALAQAFTDTLDRGLAELAHPRHAITKEAS